MKHVEVCTGEPHRFRVFCDTRGEYVLDNVTLAALHTYFREIATMRASDAVADLVTRALAAGPRPKPRQLH